MKTFFELAMGLINISISATSQEGGGRSCWTMVVELGWMVVLGIVFNLLCGSWKDGWDPMCMICCGISGIGVWMNIRPLLWFIWDMLKPKWQFLRCCCEDPFELAVECRSLLPLWKPPTDLYKLIVLACS